MRRALVVAALGMLLVFTGCDSGPDGPGDARGSIQVPGSSLGGVVMEVVGPGIQGFSGAGGSKVFWARQDQPNTYRVIVIGETGGDLDFLVSVQDRSRRKPRGSIISAVNLTNQPLVPITNDFRVKIAY